MDYPTPYVLKQTDAIAPVRDALSPDALGEKKDDDSNFLDDERESSPSALENSVHAGIANIPFKWRALALVTAITFSSGQEWADSALGPLKNTLRNELGINNTQYGVIDAAGGVVNCIWPVLGGLCLDWFGVGTISIICTGTSLLGAVIAALGPTLGVWRLIVVGHILIGFGTAVLDSAQHKIMYHYFGSSSLAFAYGIESAVAASISLTSGSSAIPISEGTGWYGWTLWIPVFFCLFSFSTNLLWVISNRYWIPEPYRLTSARDAAMTKGLKAKAFDFSTILRLPWAFLILPMTQLFQSGAASAFDSSASDLIRMRDGMSEQVAAFTAQGGKVLPILLAPIIGFSVDRWGHRMHLVAAAPLFWITGLATIGWSSVHPLVPVVIASLGKTINSFPFAVSQPLLVRSQGKLGTAFGVWRAFNNSGSTIMSIIYGRVQDMTTDMGYINVLKIGLGMKSLAFFLGLFYIFLDHRYWGRTLTMSVKDRLAAEALVKDPETDPLTARPSKKIFTTIALCEWAIIAPTAIALFVYFTM